MSSVEVGDGNFSAVNSHLIIFASRACNSCAIGDVAARRAKASVARADVLKCFV